MLIAFGLGIFLKNMTPSKYSDRVLKELFIFVCFKVFLFGKKKTLSILVLKSFKVGVANYTMYLTNASCHPLLTQS